MADIDPIATANSDPVQKLLSRYEIAQANGMVGTLCRPCPKIQLIARDLDGNQDGLNLAELVEQAAEHEQEAHSG